MSTHSGGRVVVVTGAARGIGEAICRAFTEEEKAQVIGLDLLEPTDPIAGVTYLRANIAEPESVRAAFAEITGREGRVDVLVNNAGIQRVGLIGDLPYEQWAAVIDTNLSGAFLCDSQAVPIMRRQGSGSIVHVASVAAFVGMPGRAAYTAAKAGLLGLTRVMAVELAPLGIRVNAVAPGFTRTGLVERALSDGSLREDWMTDRVPMGRLATPEEIARVVRFLASDDAAFVTGQVLAVDGGWAVQGIGAVPGWLQAPAAEPQPESARGAEE